MNNKVEMINLDSDLRRHLLYGSVGLVVAVLLVFFNVTYHVSSDLGETIEAEYTHVEIDKILVTIDNLAQSDKLNKLQEKKIPQHYLSDHNYALDKDIVVFKVWIVDRKFNMTRDIAFDHVSEITTSMLNKTSNEDFIQVNGERYFWVYKFNSENKSELLFIKRVYALDRAIAYMTTRLSISTFITFWLAVWAALIISALITKRFIKGNVRLNYLANHDSLTNLPNRTYLYEVVNRYLQNRSRKLPSVDNVEFNAAMLLVDLNKFKMVNDTMGHHIGDILLTSIASRLKTFVSESTFAFRYGGDEFIIWSENTDQAAAEKLAENIIEVCRKILHIRGSQFEMSVSVGIACYPEEGKNFNDLFKRADVAMYHAKRMRLGYQTYQKSLDLRSSLRVNLSGQLNHALTHNQFVLYYQPKVNIIDGTIYGVEALVRWNHPVEGVLAPDVFINLIEQSDFVHVFTRNVFKQAILQCKKWRNEGLSLSVAVNISPYNLLDAGLIDFLIEQLTLHDVPPNLIEIELTESATMVDIEVTQKVFKQFSDIGVELSIDDFGTGMSSLSYIKQLNVDYIKIDRSFIMHIDTDVADEAIVMSILLLCQKLNRKVVVEGVETKQQRDMLVSLGCKLAQGFYFGKPVPEEQLTPQLIQALTQKAV